MNFTGTFASPDPSQIRKGISVKIENVRESENYNSSRSLLIDINSFYGLLSDRRGKQNIYYKVVKTSPQ